MDTGLLEMKILLPFLIIVFASVSFAQESRVSVARAVYTKKAISIDGILNEQAWLSAEPITDFTQRGLHEGEKTTEKTIVKLLYNDDNLYQMVVLRPTKFHLKSYIIFQQLSARCYLHNGIMRTTN